MKKEKKIIDSIIFQEEDFIKNNNGKISLIYLSKLFIFNTNFKKSFIFIRRSKKKIDQIINIVSYIFIILGLISISYWVYLNLNFIQIDPSYLLSFYKNESIFISIFLFSLFFVMFSIYRFSENQASLKKIKKIKFKNNFNNLNSKNLKKIDIYNFLSEEVLLIMENSFLLASKLKQREVSTIHLFWSMLSSPQINSLLIRLNVNIPSLVSLLKKYLRNSDAENYSTEKIKLSDHVQEILLSSFADAYNNKQDSIGVLNIILFCYQKNPILQEILYELEISQNKIENAVKWFRINNQMYRDYKTFKKMARLKPGNNMNKSYTAIATPTLDYFSRDMTVMAKYSYFEFCVSREKEFIQIFDSLESGQNGVLLIGNNGVGKRTIVEGLAQLMVKEDVPLFLRDKRLVELDVSRLISGASISQAQERLMNIINEIQRSKNIILFIENIENIMSSSSSNEGLELSEVLAESLNKSNFYCIASANRESYTAYLEGRSLTNLMSVINIVEPDFDQAICMLESKISWIENKYGVYFDYNSLEEAVKLSSRYINDKFLPEKAVNVIKSVAVKNSKQSLSNPDKKVCTKNDVAEIISEITGIPLSKVSESEGEKLLNLEEKIHERMIGQEEAVSAVSGSLRRARAELRELSRPIASFLFLGPTGVGKTELAKSVSEVYFGSEDYMIRLDMSEYQLADSIKKMIGDVDGSIGYLTEAVRKKPFSLILFDEIEKAHPDILNLFLQILDDGRLTDGQGRTINFTNSIIISTSNAGAFFIQDSVKKNIDTSIIKQALIDEHLNQVMRPELINRFDGIIVFKPLNLENVLAIAKLMIKKIEKSLLNKGISLLYDDDGLLKLAQAGYDPKFGARPLRRLLQDKIENEIANLLLGGKLSRRDIVFINDLGQIEIEKAKDL